MHHSVIALSGILSPSAPQLLLLLSPKRILENNNAAERVLNSSTEKANKQQNTIDIVGATETNSSAQFKNSKNSKLKSTNTESKVTSSSSSSSLSIEADGSITIFNQVNRTPREMLSLLLARSLHSLCSPSRHESEDNDNNNVSALTFPPRMKSHYHMEDTANTENALGNDGSSATLGKKEATPSYRRWNNKSKESRQILKIDMTSRNNNTISDASVNFDENNTKHKNSKKKQIVKEVQTLPFALALRLFAESASALIHHPELFNLSIVQIFSIVHLHIDSKCNNNNNTSSVGNISLPDYSMLNGNVLMPLINRANSSAVAQGRNLQLHYFTHELQSSFVQLFMIWLEEKGYNASTTENTPNKENVHYEKDIIEFVHDVFDALCVSCCANGEQTNFNETKLQNKYNNATTGYNNNYNNNRKDALPVMQETSHEHVIPVDKAYCTSHAMSLRKNAELTHREKKEEKDEEMWKTDVKAKPVHTLASIIELSALQLFLLQSLIAFYNSNNNSSSSIDMEMEVGEKKAHITNNYTLQLILTMWREINEQVFTFQVKSIASNNNNNNNNNMCNVQERVIPHGVSGVITYALKQARTLPENRMSYNNSYTYTNHDQGNSANNYHNSNGNEYNTGNFYAKLARAHRLRTSIRALLHMYVSLIECRELCVRHSFTFTLIQRSLVSFDLHKENSGNNNSIYKQKNIDENKGKKSNEPLLMSLEKVPKENTELINWLQPFLTFVEMLQRSWINDAERSIHEENSTVAIWWLQLLPCMMQMYMHVLRWRIQYVVCSELEQVTSWSESDTSISSETNCVSKKNEELLEKLHSKLSWLLRRMLHYNPQWNVTQLISPPPQQSQETPINKNGFAEFNDEGQISSINNDHNNKSEMGDATRATSNNNSDIESKNLNVLTNDNSSSNNENDNSKLESGNAELSESNDALHRSRGKRSLFYHDKSANHIILNDSNNINGSSNNDNDNDNEFEEISRQGRRDSFANRFTVRHAKQEVDHLHRINGKVGKNDRERRKKRKIAQELMQMAEQRNRQRQGTKVNLSDLLENEEIEMDDNELCGAFFSKLIQKNVENNVTHTNHCKSMEEAEESDNNNYQFTELHNNHSSSNKESEMYSRCNKRNDEVINELVNHFSLWKSRRETLLEENWLSMLLSYSNVMRVLYETYTPSEKSHLLLPDAHFNQQERNRRIRNSNQEELQSQECKEYEKHKQLHTKSKVDIVASKRANFQNEEWPKRNNHMSNDDNDNSSRDTFYAMKMLELGQDGERSWQKWIREMLCESVTMEQNKVKFSETNKLIEEICNRDRIKCRLLQLLAHTRELLPLHVLHHATHLIRFIGSVIAKINSTSGRSSNLSSLLPPNHSSVPTLSSLTQENNPTIGNTNNSTYLSSGKAYREPQQILKEENLHTALLISTELELHLHTLALHSLSSSCIARRNIIIDSIYNGFMYKLEQIKHPTFVNDSNTIKEEKEERIMSTLESLQIANYWELELQHCVSDALENPLRILCNMRNAYHFLQRQQYNITSKNCVNFDEKLYKEKNEESKNVCPLFTTQLACMFLLRNIDCLLLQSRHSSCTSQRVNKWIFKNTMKGMNNNNSSSSVEEHFNSTYENSIYECAHMYEFLITTWSTNTELLLANCTPYVLNRVGSVHKRLSAELVQLQRSKHSNNNNNNKTQIMIVRLTNLFMDFVLYKLFPLFFVHVLNGVRQFTEMNSTSAGSMTINTNLHSSNISNNYDFKKHTHIDSMYTDNVEYSVTFFQRLFLMCMSVTDTQIHLNSIALEEVFSTSHSSSSSASSSTRLMNEKKINAEQLRKVWSEVIFRYSMYVLQHIQKYSNIYTSTNSNPGMYLPAMALHTGSVSNTTSSSSSSSSFYISNNIYNSDNFTDVSSNVHLSELEQLVHKALDLVKKTNHSTCTSEEDNLNYSHGTTRLSNNKMQFNDFLWILEMDDARELSVLTRYRSITQLEPLPFHVMMERLRHGSERHLHAGYEQYLIAAKRKAHTIINKDSDKEWKEGKVEDNVNEEFTTINRNKIRNNSENKSSRDVIISFQEENNAIHSALTLLSSSSSSSSFNALSSLSQNNNGEGIERNGSIKPPLPTFSVSANTMPPFSPFAFMQHFNYHDLFACTHFIRFMIKENQTQNAPLQWEREDAEDNIEEVQSTREGNNYKKTHKNNNRIHSKGTNYLCDIKTSLTSQSNMQRNTRELNDCLVLLRICKMLHGRGGWGLLNMTLSLSANIGRVMKRRKREQHRTEFSSDLTVIVNTTTCSNVSNSDSAQQEKLKQAPCVGNENVEKNSIVPTAYTQNNKNNDINNNMRGAQVNVSEANYEVVRSLIVQSICVQVNHILLPIPGQPLDYTFMWKVAIALGELLSPVGLHLLNSTREGALVAWAAPHSSQMQLNTKVGNSHYESFIYGFRQLVLHLHEGSSQFCVNAYFSSSSTMSIADVVDDMNETDVNNEKEIHLQENIHITSKMPRYYREIWTSTNAHERNAQRANEEAAKEFAKFLLTVNCTFHGICEFIYYHVLSASEQHPSDKNKRSNGINSNNVKTGVNTMFNKEWVALLRMMLETLLNDLTQCINSHLAVQKVNITHTQFKQNSYEDKNNENKQPEVMFVNEYAVLLWSSMSALSLLERLRGAINHSRSVNNNSNNSFSSKKSLGSKEWSNTVYDKSSDSNIKSAWSDHHENSFVSTVAEREQWERVVCAFTSKTHDLVVLHTKMTNASSSSSSEWNNSFVEILQRGLELIEMSMYNSRRSTAYSVGLPFRLRNDITSVLITLHHLMENVSTEQFSREHNDECINKNADNITTNNEKVHVLESNRFTASDVFYTVWKCIAEELVGKQSIAAASILQISNDNEEKELKGKKCKKRGRKTKKNATSSNSDNNDTKEKESKLAIEDNSNNKTLQKIPIKVPHMVEFKVIVNKIINLPVIAEKQTKQEESCSLKDKSDKEDENRMETKREQEYDKEIIKMVEIEKLTSHLVEDVNAAFTPLLECSKENEEQLLQKFSSSSIDLDDDVEGEGVVAMDGESDNVLDLKDTNKMKSKTRLRSGRRVYNYELYHQSFSVEEALNEKVLSLHEVVEHLTTQGTMVKRRLLDIVRSATLAKTNPTTTKMKKKNSEQWEEPSLSLQKEQMELENGTHTSMQSVSWALASSPNIVAQTRTLYELHLHNLIVLLENYTLTELVAEPKSAMLFSTLRSFKEKIPQLYSAEGANHHHHQQTVTNHLRRLWQLLINKFREEYVKPNHKLFVESYQELSLCKDVSILEKRNMSKSKRRKGKSKRWKDLFSFTSSSYNSFCNQGEEAKRRIEHWYLSMVSLHNPSSINNAHNQINSRHSTLNATSVYDTRSGYLKKSNYDSSELLFWHDHLNYYPFNRVNCHKDNTKENVPDNNDNNDVSKWGNNNNNVINLKTLRYYTSSTWHWKPLLSQTKETPVLFPLHVMLSLFRTLDGLSSVRAENLLYEPFLFLELLLQHGVQHFVALRPRSDCSAINIIPFILRSWQLQTSSTSITRKTSEANENNSLALGDNEEEEETRVEEDNRENCKKNTVMVVVDKESVLKKYSPNVHYATSVRNTFFTLQERERLQREFELLTSSSSSLVSSNQAGQQPLISTEEMTFDYIRYGIFYVEVITQIICSYSEYVNRLKRDVNLQKALMSALTSSSSFSQTNEFAMNDNYTPHKSNSNTAENERSKERKNYKIDNWAPLAWTRELTTLMSNRSTRDITFGNYSNYNKKIYDDRMANISCNNINNKMIDSSKREDGDVVMQLLYSQLYNVISVLSHHSDSLSHLALDKTALLEWNAWRHKYELLKKLTLSSDGVTTSEVKGNESLSDKATCYSDQVQYEQQQQQQQQQQQCEYNFRYVNEMRHMVSSAIQSTLTKLEESKWEDSTSSRFDTPYALMPLLSQLTCLLLLQTSSLTLTHFTLSVHNTSNWDSESSENVNQGKPSKAKRSKQKGKQDEQIMRNNSKMLKMTKDINDTSEIETDSTKSNITMDSNHNEDDDNEDGVENTEHEINKVCENSTNKNAELDKARVRIYSSVANYYPNLSIGTPTLLEVFTPVFLMNTIAPRAHCVHDAEINTLINILSYYVTVHARFSAIESTSPLAQSDFTLHRNNDNYFNNSTDGFTSNSNEYESSKVTYESMSHHHLQSSSPVNAEYSQEHKAEEQTFVTAMMNITATIIGNTDIRTMALKMFCEKFVKYIIRMFTKGNATNTDNVQGNTNSNSSFATQHDKNSNLDVNNSHTRSNQDEINPDNALQHNVLQHVPNEVLITFLASMSRRDVELHKKSLGALLYYAMHSRLHLFGHPPLDTRQGKLSLVRVNSAQATSALLNTANPLYASTTSGSSNMKTSFPAPVNSNLHAEGKSREMIGKKLTLRNPSMPQLTICTPVPNEGNEKLNKSSNDKENEKEEDTTETRNNEGENKKAEEGNENSNKNGKELSEEDMHHQLRCLSSFQLSTHTTLNDLYDGNQIENNGDNTTSFAMNYNIDDENSKAMMTSHRLTLSNLHLPITTILFIISHYIALRKLSHEELTYAVRMLRSADEARRERVSQYNSLLQVVAAQKDEAETTQLRRRKQSNNETETNTTTKAFEQNANNTLSPVSHSNTSTFALTDGLKGLNASLELADPTDYGITILHLKFALQKIIHASIRNYVTSPSSNVNTEILAELMEILCVLEAPKRVFKHDHTNSKSKNKNKNYRDYDSNYNNTMESEKNTNQYSINANNKSCSGGANDDKNKSFPLVPLRSSMNTNRVNNNNNKNNMLTMTSMVHATSKLDSMTQGTLRVLLSRAITHAQGIGYNKYGEILHYPPSLVSKASLQESVIEESESKKNNKLKHQKEKEKAQEKEKQNMKEVYTIEPILYSHLDLISGNSVRLSSLTESDSAKNKEVQMKCAMEAEAAISLGSTSTFVSFAEKNSTRLAIHRIKKNVGWRDKYYAHAREHWQKNVSSSSTH